MKEKGSQSSGIESLKTLWPRVVELAPAYAEQILRYRKLLPLSDQRSLRSVEQWFRGPVKLEDALKRPGVTCFCVSLSQRLAAEQAAGDETERLLRGAAQAGIQRFFQQSPGRTGAGNLLRYTFAILLGVMFVFGLISFVVLPQFQLMYDEFGIDLPRMTELFFSLGQLVRGGGWGLLPMMAVLWLLFEVQQAQQWRGSKPLNLGKVAVFVTGQRSLGAWLAYQVSNLLRLGVDREHALNVVGKDAGGTTPVELLATRYPLIWEGLADRSVVRSIATLDASGHYLRTVGDTKRAWVLRLLNSAMLVAAFVLVLAVILSLFTPLMAIVSGVAGPSFF